MNPDVLGILITSRCNARCRHCCNDSHPGRTETLSAELIKRYISEAAAIPSVREIGISGGEPFLFFPLLREITRFAASLKLSAAVTSNGFWARSPARARAMLAELKACGLRGINISTSAFHREYVPTERVVCAAEAALELGLVVRVNHAHAGTWQETGELTSRLGELAQRVELVEFPVLPTGRAAVDARPEELGRSDPAIHRSCAADFKKLAIDQHGDLYPCCSPGGFTPPLKLGNVDETPIPELVAAAQRNPLLSVLESVGPGFFVPFLRSALPDFPLHHRDACHLCHAVMTDPAAERVARSAVGQLFSALESESPMPPSAEPMGPVERLVQIRRNPKHST